MLKGAAFSEAQYHNEIVPYTENGLIGLTLQSHDEIQAFADQGGIQMDFYQSDVKALSRDKDRMGMLEADLARYDRSHSPIKLPRNLPRMESIVFGLATHPDVMSDLSQGNLSMKVPLYTLMDIANRTDFGIYQTEKPALSNALSSDQFHTLSHLPLWREQMAAIAEKQLLRIATQHGIMPQLVMIGDGSGATGQTIIQRLTGSGIPLNVIHIDIASPLLETQKEAYNRAGIDGSHVTSIEADATKIDEVLNEHGVHDGFFVLNEILDTFPAHALVYGKNGVKEVHQTISNDDLSLQALKPSDPLLDRLDTYFPWLQIGENDMLDNQEKNIGFSPHWILFIKKLMNSTNHASIYIGDYAGAFATRNFSYLPLRTYGHESQTGTMHDFFTLLSHPIDITTDVPPSILHLAEAWGGSVENIGTTADFLFSQNPQLRELFDRRLNSIRKKAQNPNQKATRKEILEDLFFVSYVMSPGAFGSLITKGL